MHPLHLEGKWRIQAHGRGLVLPKRAGEKASHCWMKGFLWYLYLPGYPHLQVEKPIGHRYKPDVVAFAEAAQGYPQHQPLFWGEAGQVMVKKLETLFRQFPDTHFAVAKWGQLGNWVQRIEGALPRRRRAPVDLLCFPEDGLEQFVDPGGDIQLELNQVLRRRWT